MKSAKFHCFVLRQNIYIYISNNGYDALALDY